MWTRWMCNIKGKTHLYIIICAITRIGNMYMMRDFIFIYKNKELHFSKKPCYNGFVKRFIKKSGRKILWLKKQSTTLMATT